MVIDRSDECMSGVVAELHAGAVDRLAGRGDGLRSRHGGAAASSAQLLAARERPASVRATHLKFAGLYVWRSAVSGLSGSCVVGLIVGTAFV